jgi:carbamoyl-phosphate synthase small subunit
VIPEPCDYAISAIKEFLEADIPLFGICLGCQLLALACGANTIKMRLGHPRCKPSGTESWATVR